MGEVQETDKTMRIMAIIGGIIALIEAIVHIIGIEYLPYGFGLIGGVLAIIFSILAIGLGVKPIPYTPVFLAILGILLIVFASLIGGIIVLLATFLGAIS
ncbi:MAG: hypothetical protein ACFFB0_12260 [Promethearchaeota archaeon]